MAIEDIGKNALQTGIMMKTRILLRWRTAFTS